MAAILQQIGTPLQLTALFLLLVAGIAQLLVRLGAWKPSPGTTRLVIDRIFQAAVAAFVLGVASQAIAPALDRWLNGDETFHGAVLSTTGEPIAGATVDLIAIGSALTNALGQFDITVSRNRVLKAYKLEVRAPGYAPLLVLTKSATEMKNVEIRLTPAPPELVKALEPTLFVGQYYGVPFVVVTLRVENAAASLASINEIRGELSGKDASFTLSPAYWTIVSPFGPFAPVPGALPIPSGINLDLRVVMMTGVNFANLTPQVAELPEYRSQQPCARKPNGAVDPMTDGAFQIVKAFAEEHFAWRDGDWRLRLDVTAGAETKTFERLFALSSGEIGRLRASIALLRQCLSVNMTAPLAQDGGVANFVSKQD
jgi:hypothetical protein